MYVTLEPCCHHGKQPPCTEAIIEHGISKVYVGSNDPNELVAGKGIQVLRDAGVEVVTEFLKEECDAFSASFCSCQKRLYSGCGSIVAKMVDASFAVVTTLLDNGIRSLESQIILTGFLPPSIRQVSLGSSFNTVPIPTIIPLKAFRVYGQIISEGYHKVYGDLHAERNAFQNLKKKEDAKGAQNAYKYLNSIYSLLPSRLYCRHRNLTGSCLTARGLMNPEIICWKSKSQSFGWCCDCKRWTNNQ